jgi:hypothetical protein
LKCIICGGETIDDGYCRFHEGARQTVIRKYENWRKAMGISWKEYLSEIAKNPLTGEWAKEVALYLLEEENKKNVKNG